MFFSIDLDGEFAFCKLFLGDFDAVVVEFLEFFVAEVDEDRSALAELEASASDDPAFFVCCKRVFG